MKIRVEIADTPMKLATGLMHRERLASDAGMLFVFPRPQRLSFWGKNTLIPLDIAFVDRFGAIRKIAKIKKHDLRPVACSEPCTMAIEVNEGFFAHHGITEGDFMVVASDRFEGDIVRFEKNGGASGRKNESPTKTAQALPNGFGWSPSGTSIPTAFTSEGQDEPPVPEWMQEAQWAKNDSPEAFDDASLPDIPLDQFSFADDDEQDQGSAPGQPGEAPEDQQGEEPIPDAGSMSVPDAIRMAIEKGYVMQINYTTAPKKRTIGPPPMPKTIDRLIQPHGIVHAKTTGNVLVVTWDLTVNGFRAFILDRIRDKEFTGQRFTRWFTVSGA